jgi:hypothetical protein
MARGGHELPKVSPWATMPIPYAGRPAGRAGKVACDHFLPLWTPHTLHLCRRWRTDSIVQLIKEKSERFKRAISPIQKFSLPHSRAVWGV